MVIKWAVKLQGNSKASKVFNTKEPAVKYATDRAKEEKSELIVKRQDGSIQYKNTYGDDPHPPKG